MALLLEWKIILHIHLMIQSSDDYEMISYDIWAVQRAME